MSKQIESRQNNGTTEMETNEKWTPFINQTLSRAGEIASGLFGTVKGSTKEGDNNQVLTEADLRVGTYIVKQIKAEYPNDNIIDEEAGVIDNGSDRTWVVDPIDGTSNFANRLPHYGVMIGLLSGSKPVAGGVILPEFNKVYVAQKGLGAFCNGEHITATDEQRLLHTLVAYGIDGHQENPDLTRAEVEDLGRIILGIRNLRTSNSAYDMMQVAQGTYGAFLNRTTKIWDNVAVQPILEEAGVLVTDFWGKPMDYSDPLNHADQNYTICAAPPMLHKQLQEIIHS